MRNNGWRDAYKGEKSNKNMSKRVTEKYVMNYLKNYSLFELFDVKDLLNWDTEQLLINLKKKQIEFSYEKILFWDKFQSLANSFDEDFKSIIFCNCEVYDDYLLLSDLFNDYAMWFKLEEFDFLMNNIFKIDFFQPNDYLFINTSKRTICAIHHSGYIAKCKLF